MVPPSSLHFSGTIDAASFFIPVSTLYTVVFLWLGSGLVHLKTEYTQAIQFSFFLLQKIALQSLAFPGLCIIHTHTLCNIDNLTPTCDPPPASS